MAQPNNVLRFLFDTAGHRSFCRSGFPVQGSGSIAQGCAGEHAERITVGTSLVPHFWRARSAIPSCAGLGGLVCMQHGFSNNPG